MSRAMNTNVAQRISERTAVVQRKEVLTTLDQQAVQAGTEGLYLTDGGEPVGPIAAELLARQIRLGLVPSEALVWKRGWPSWRKITEYAAQHGLSLGAMGQPSQQSAPSIPEEQQREWAALHNDCQALEQSADLRQAASVFLMAGARLTGAQGGWVHVLNRQAAGAIMTVHGLGPRAVFGIGRTLEPSDQALRVAREGRTVLGEPIPGVVGAAVAARLVSAGVTPSSVAMVPVVSGGQLLVMLELGHTDPGGISLRQAAHLEQLGRYLGTLARKRGWHRG